MDVTPLVPKGKKLITAYGKDYVVIGQKKNYIPIIVTPDKLILEVESIEQLESLDPKPEIILIGSDKERKRLDIKAEIMSFGAACRTYNVLLGEGREVALFLCNEMGPDI